MPSDHNITYIVGEEKRLTDIVSEADVMPLLRGAVRAGASLASVTDDRGSVLWEWGSAGSGTMMVRSLPLCLEGEPVGSLELGGDASRIPVLELLTELFREVFHVLLVNNLKRKLTTEIHAGVVSRSYDELVETNRRLAESEAGYRELAENLEMKVRERTEELKKAHLRLLQREKMAAVGCLAAGVAHEINNPLAFIISNLHTLEKYAHRFVSMLEWLRDGEAGGPAVSGERIREKWGAMKMDYVRDDTFALIGQCIEGAERVSRIVSDLKDFSHVDDSEQLLADLNDEIDGTLKVLAHEIPADAEIVREYRPLPLHCCNPALLCQAFLNIILNALQSRDKGLRLLIRTGLENDCIYIVFADNGPGIPAEVRSRIFEPFYTTREVGSGTGTGLSVAYDVVTGHGGGIEVDCPPEGGAVFTIRLPLKRMG